MEMTPTWQYRWFGLWSWPTPNPHSSRPFLGDWIDPAWAPDDRDQIIEYLETCPAVVVAAKGTYPCPLCDEQLYKILYRSDGTWNWSGSLPHMMRAHGVRIPEELSSHIRGVGYHPPSRVTLHPRDLPWPPRDT